MTMFKTVAIRGERMIVKILKATTTIIIATRKLL